MNISTSMELHFETWVQSIFCWTIVKKEHPGYHSLIVRLYSALEKSQEDKKTKKIIRLQRLSMISHMIKKQILGHLEWFYSKWQLDYTPLIIEWYLKTNWIQRRSQAILVKPLKLLSAESLRSLTSWLHLTCQNHLLIWSVSCCTRTLSCALASLPVWNTTGLRKACSCPLNRHREEVLSTKTEL